MEAQKIIERILSASIPEEVANPTGWIEHYKKIMLLIHPDRCSLPGASAAAARLNELKNLYEKGKRYTDESGRYCSIGHRAVFEGDLSLLKTSYNNYSHLQSIGSSHFLRYLPEKMTWEDNRLTVRFSHRSIPLSGLQLPQEHVNWILSRLLEFTALLECHGYVHCGLTPESVFAVPETHGIQVATFYHMTALGRNVSTISAAHKNWYPSRLFTDRTAKSYIDLELSKKNAVCLLGDSSGSGVKLKKTHLAAFVDFLITSDQDPAPTYARYRTLLKQHFENRFHILHL